MDNAYFTVQLDDKPPVPGTAKSPNGFQSQVLLWSETGLSRDVQHTIVVTHDDLPGTWMTFDKLMYVYYVRQQARLTSS